MPRAKSKAVITAEADAKWWNEEWLKFPTVSLDDEGKRHYWDVTGGVGEALDHIVEGAFHVQHHGV